MQKDSCGKAIAEGFLLQEDNCRKAIAEGFMLQKGRCGKAIAKGCIPAHGEEYLQKEAMEFLSTSTKEMLM